MVFTTDSTQSLLLILNRSTSSYPYPPPSYLSVSKHKRFDTSLTVCQTSVVLTSYLIFPVSSFCSRLHPVYTHPTLLTEKRWIVVWKFWITEVCYLEIITSAQLVSRRFETTWPTPDTLVVTRVITQSPAHRLTPDRPEPTGVSERPVTDPLFRYTKSDTQSDRTRSSVSRRSFSPLYVRWSLDPNLDRIVLKTV